MIEVVVVAAAVVVAVVAVVMMVAMVVMVVVVVVVLAATATAAVVLVSCVIYAVLISHYVSYLRSSVTCGCGVLNFTDIFFSGQLCQILSRNIEQAESPLAFAVMCVRLSLSLPLLLVAGLVILCYFSCSFFFICCMFLIFHLLVYFCCQ